MSNFPLDSPLGLNTSERRVMFGDMFQLPGETPTPKLTQNVLDPSSKGTSEKIHGSGGSQFDFDDVDQHFPSPRGGTNHGISPARWDTSINSAGSLGSITREGEGIFFPEGGYEQQRRSHSGGGISAKKHVKKQNKRDSSNSMLSNMSELSGAEEGGGEGGEGNENSNMTHEMDMADALLALPSSPHYFTLPSPTMSDFGAFTEGFGDPSSARSSYNGLTNMSHSGLRSGGSSRGSHEGVIGAGQGQALFNHPLTGFTGSAFPLVQSAFKDNSALKLSGGGFSKLGTSSSSRTPGGGTGEPGGMGTGSSSGKKSTGKKEKRERGDESTGKGKKGTDLKNHEYGDIADDDDALILIENPQSSHRSFEDMIKSGKNSSAKSKK
jgi:hypothetical protein